MMLSFPAPANGGQPVQNEVGQTMRLRDEPSVITPPARATRKRKSPTAPSDHVQQPPPQPPQPPQQQQQQQQIQHVLPPPHTLMHLASSIPPGFPYAAPADYTPGGLPPGPLPIPQQHDQPQTSSTGRTLSNSKRAEQNRKAQRAFRERRDQSAFFALSARPLLMPLL